MAKKKQVKQRSKNTCRKNVRATIEEKIDVILASLLNLENVVRTLQFEIQQLNSRINPTNNIPYVDTPPPITFPYLQDGTPSPAIPQIPIWTDKSSTGKDAYQTYCERSTIKPCEGTSYPVVCCRG